MVCSFVLLKIFICFPGKTCQGGFTYFAAKHNSGVSVYKSRYKNAGIKTPVYKGFSHRSKFRHFLLIFFTDKAINSNVASYSTDNVNRLEM